MSLWILLRPLLILFAKAPVAGFVKTRLCPPLTPIEAAGLHSAMVLDAARLVATLPDIADIELSTDTVTDEWPAIPFRRTQQVSGELGERLFHALQQGLERGHRAAMVLGCDSPGLPPGHLTRLLESSADVALGPVKDGGFFAIACRAVHPNMFAGVRWSSKHTLKDVIGSVSRCGLSVELGPGWFDIDDGADLGSLVEMSGLPAHTERWIEAWKIRSRELTR